MASYQEIVDYAEAAGISFDEASRILGGPASGASSTGGANAAPAAAAGGDAGWTTEGDIRYKDVAGRHLVQQLTYGTWQTLSNTASSESGAATYGAATIVNDQPYYPFEDANGVPQGWRDANGNTVTTLPKAITKGPAAPVQAANLVSEEVLRNAGAVQVTANRWELTLPDGRVVPYTRDTQFAGQFDEGAPVAAKAAGPTQPFKEMKVGAITYLYDVSHGGMEYVGSLAPSGPGGPPRIAYDAAYIAKYGTPGQTMTPGAPGGVAMNAGVIPGGGVTQEMINHLYNPVDQQVPYDYSHLGQMEVGVGLSPSQIASNAAGTTDIPTTKWINSDTGGGGALRTDIDLAMANAARLYRPDAITGQSLSERIAAIQAEDLTRTQAGRPSLLRGPNTELSRVGPAADAMKAQMMAAYDAAVFDAKIKADLVNQMGRGVSATDRGAATMSDLLANKLQLALTGQGLEATPNEPTYNGVDLGYATRERFTTPSAFRSQPRRIKPLDAKEREELDTLRKEHDLSLLAPLPVPPDPLGPQEPPPGFGRGGQYTLNEPTMGIGMKSGDTKFIAGEMGPEQAAFTPLAPPMVKPRGIDPEILRNMARQIHRQLRVTLPAGLGAT